jgi:hypothetical protein
MPSIPGVVGSRRIADEVDKKTGEMKTIPARPWDKAFIERVTNTQNTFTTALADIRYRIGGLTRQLLAQGKHMTMNQAEYKAATASIDALSQTFVAACAMVENLHKVACSDVWVSQDVEKVAKDLAALVHAATDLDAFRQLPDSMVPKTAKVMGDCANVLRKGSEVLGLVREVSGIELGVNNLGMTAEEFKRLAGVDEPEDHGPEPRDLLPRSVRSPEPMTADELAQVERLREEARSKFPVAFEEPLGVGAVEDLGGPKSPTPVHLHPNPADVRKAMMDDLVQKTEERAVIDTGEPEAQRDPRTRVCDHCGLEDPPRGEGIPAVVEKRANDKMLCFTCWQVQSGSIRDN